MKNKSVKEWVIMKKIIKQLIAFIMVVTMVVSEMPVMNAKADESEAKYYDGFYYDINEDGESVSIIGCDLSGDIVIPEEIDGMKVTRIGGGEYFWYGGMDIYVTSVKLPESLTSIGAGTFSGCVRLTSINLPESLTGIGEYTFCRCSSLTSINLPESLTSIGKEAFSGCSSLLNIYIPAGVTEIAGNPFSGCTAVESIKVSTGNSKYDSREDCNAIIYTSGPYSRLTVGCKNTKLPSDLTENELSES